MDSPSHNFLPSQKICWAPARRLGHKYFLARKFRDPDSARQPPSLKLPSIQFQPNRKCSQHFLAHAKSRYKAAFFARAMGADPTASPVH